MYLVILRGGKHYILMGAKADILVDPGEFVSKLHDSCCSVLKADWNYFCLDFKSGYLAISNDNLVRNYQCH